MKVAFVLPGIGKKHNEKYLKENMLPYYKAIMGEY